MIFRLPAVACALVACAVPLFAQALPEAAPMPRDPAVKPDLALAVQLDQKILAEIKSHSEIMTNLGYLSDTIGPRLTGSENLTTANKWTADKFKEYGLENVRLEPWEIPVGWKRGTATLKMANGRQLLVASRGWSPGTNGPVTGPVVVADIRTKDDMAKYKGKLKNAIILRGKPTNVAPISDLRYGPTAGIPAKKPDPKKADPKANGQAQKNLLARFQDRLGRTPPGTPGRATTPEEMEKRFAEMQALRRSVDDFYKAEGVAAFISDAGKPHGLLVTTGGWREGDRGTPQDPIPGLFMAHEHYATLYRAVQAGGDTPPEVTLEVTNTFIPGPITVFNTVAEVVGKDKPEEIVVIGAHLDSWDLGTGTTDNGTGSTVVMEVARTIAKLAAEGDRPSRTIRFVLFTGEEQGLYGSKRYCEKHKADMPKHSMALVHDTGTGRVLGFGLQGRAAVKDVLEPELESLRSIEGWTGLTLDRMGGTDHLSFERYNVPGFACKQDADEYRLTHHTQTDTFDKAKEPNLIQGAQVIAVTAMRVANLPDLLPRDKPTPPAGGPGGRRPTGPAGN